MGLPAGAQLCKKCERDRNVVKAGDLYKSSEVPIKDKILGLFKTDKSAGFIMEFFKESVDETRKTDTEMFGWMSQYEIADICKWNLSIEAHKELLESLLPTLKSSEDWDDTKPYDAMMKRNGELKYYFEKELVSKKEDIESAADREIGKLNKSGNQSHIRLYMVY